MSSFSAQEEQHLLAALGTTTTSASDYERSVIHAAELAHVPQLATALLDDDHERGEKDGRCRMGLPGLEALAPGWCFDVLASASGSSGSRAGAGRRKRQASVDKMRPFLTALMASRTELSNLLYSGTGTSRNASAASNTSISDDTNDANGTNEANDANEKRITTLKMKQQMILSFLFQKCGYKEQEAWDVIRQETGYDERTEREEERTWKARIAGSMAAASEEAAAAAALQRSAKRLAEEGGDGMDAEEMGTSATTGRIRGRKRGAAAASPIHLHALSAQQRLERIKNADEAAGTSTSADANHVSKERTSTVQFASATSQPSTSTSSSSKARKRQSMMTIRHQMDVSSGSLEQRQNNLEEVERRRQKRQERRKRRLERTQRRIERFAEGRREERAVGRRRKQANKRRRGAEKKEDGKDSRKEEEDEDEDEGEFEFGEEEEAEKASSASALREGEETEASAPSVVAAAQPPQRRFVSCPLCSDDLPVIGDEDADVILAAHMDDCQRLRRGGRRSSGRRRAATMKLGSYAETADNEEAEEDMEDVEEYYGEEEKKSSEPDRNRNRKRPAKRDSTSSSAESAFSDDNAADDEDDDSVMSISSPPPDYQPSDLDLGEATTGDADLDSLPFHTAPDDLEEANYDDRVDVWQEVGVKRMKDMSERADDGDEEEDQLPGPVLYDGGLVIPGWMNNRLFGYQRTGVRWMWELHRQQAGGIVGDEMGLGKTVQVCSFLGAMAASRKLGSVVIICPATMLRHWMSELSVWAPGLRRLLIHKSGESDGLTREVSGMLLKRLDKWLKRSRDDRVNEAIDEKDYDEYDEDVFCGTGYCVVTTYDAIRRNQDVWVNHRWDYIVMDEGQKIRNPDADVTLACKRFRTPYRLLLSGTPIQNDLRELWSLFDFVFPGRLGTLPTFESEYADPIKRGGYSNASPMQVQLAYRMSISLRDHINPYLLRRRKKDVKEVSRMPGKTEQVLFCRLSGRQRTMYESYLRSDDVLRALRGSNNTFKAITVLRKICNHPDLVTGPNKNSYESFLQNGYVNDDDLSSSEEEDYEDYDSDEAKDDLISRSGKLEVLAKILPLWKKQGHRVLIFCQWTKMLSIIERFVNLQGWKFGRLDGKTNIASRQKIVDSFNSDDSYFGMLLTTRTGGVGLNLTGANRIILYDPDWNPQTDAQARERAWRFGQKKQVTVYRLITAGAIEERIYHRQIFKNAISSAVLVDPKQRRLFSQKDLRDLFTLKADTGSVAKGGDGITTTGELTKGGGVIDPDADTGAEGPGGKKEDDEQTLEAVMKSKGIAGVFDHDYVEKKPSSRRSAAAREMEEQATNAANNAARALRESTAGQGSQGFTPTWTGTSGTQPRRFGGSSSGVGGFGRVAASSHNTAFGGAESAGIATSSQGAVPSSSSLLAHLQQRNASAAASAAPSRSSTGGGSDTRSSNSELLQQIKAYIKRKGGARDGGGPTTDQLLAQFSSITDASEFRRLLVSVAKRGPDSKWRLKR